MTRNHKGWLEQPPRVNSAHDVTADADTTSQLHNGSGTHSLEVGQRPRRHAGRPRVGHIVGTEEVCVEKRKYGCANIN